LSGLLGNAASPLALRSPGKNNAAASTPGDPTKDPIALVKLPRLEGIRFYVAELRPKGNMTVLDAASPARSSPIKSPGKSSLKLLGVPDEVAEQESVGASTALKMLPPPPQEQEETTSAVGPDPAESVNVAVAAQDNQEDDLLASDNENEGPPAKKMKRGRPMKVVEPKAKGKAAAKMKSKGSKKAQEKEATTATEERLLPAEGDEASVGKEKTATTKKMAAKAKAKAASSFTTSKQLIATAQTSTLTVTSASTSRAVLAAPPRIPGPCNVIYCPELQHYRVREDQNADTLRGLCSGLLMAPPKTSSTGTASATSYSD
ncbi:unnamed protein product, partial [Amoebophrya sp. A25]